MNPLWTFRKKNFLTFFNVHLCSCFMSEGLISIVQNFSNEFQLPMIIQLNAAIVIHRDIIFSDVKHTKLYESVLLSGLHFLQPHPFLCVPPSANPPSFFFSHVLARQPHPVLCAPPREPPPFLRFSCSRASAPPLSRASVFLWWL